MPYIGTSARKTRKLETLEQFEQLAFRKGISAPREKTSLFRKTLDLMMRSNYAVAGFARALTSRGVAAGENPLTEAWKGLRGEEKETFSDVLQDVGVENKWAKGILGFALDIALDPTTYFGGTLIRGGLKAGGKVGSKIVGATERVAPKRVEAIRTSFNTVGDAFKKAFIPGHGTTKRVSRLTLNGIEYDRKALEGFTIKGSKIYNAAKEQVGVIENGVIKSLKKFGKKQEQIGSLESVVSKANEFNAGTLIEYESVLAKNQNLFSKYSAKELEDAADIMIHNRGVTRRLAEFKGGELIKPKAGRQSELVDLMKKKGQELAKAAGITGEEWYFPFLDKKKFAGMKRFRNALERSGEDYKKALKGHVKREDILNKPIEAYSRRQYEIVHDVMREQVKKDLVAAFGKDAKAFKTLQEAVEAGYRPIIRGRKFVDVEDLAKGGKLADPDEVVGWLKERDFKFVNQVMFPEMKTMDMLAKASGYDAFTGMFKSLVTAWFPAFHIRNMVSGMIQNYSVLGRHAFNPATFRDGVSLTSDKFLKRIGNQVVNYGGGKYTKNQIRSALVKRFQYSSRYMTDVENVTDVVEGAMRFKNLKKMNPRRVGNWIEFNQKAGATVAALKKGKSLEEALNLAEKAGFDYSKITQFESKVMKRLIPFYTFARKNAALQVSTAVQNPQRILNQVKFTNLLSNVFSGGKPTEAELDGVPPWALNALGFKLEGGKYISKFGFPLEEFVERVADPVKTTMTSLNPLVKFPLESKTGYDFFRDKPIREITSIKEPMAKVLTNEKTPQWLRNAFSVRSWTDDSGKVHYQADPENLHRLRNLPISRFINTFDKMFEDGITDVDPEKLASFVIGAQLYDIDIELQKHFREKDLIEYYRKELEDKGFVWDWTQFFTRE